MKVKTTIYWILVIPLLFSMKMNAQSFTVVEDTIIGLFDIATINDFPANLTSSIVIYNSHPSDEVDIAWERIEQTAPGDWNYDCSFYTPYGPTDCDEEGGQFNLVQGDFTDITREIFLNDAEATGAIVSRYLLYDINDSLNSHSYLTFIDSVLIPNYTGGSFDLQSQDSFIINDLAISDMPWIGSQVAASFDFNKNSIGSVNINWRKVTDIRPTEWEYYSIMEIIPEAVQIFELDTEEEGTFELMPESDFFIVDIRNDLNSNGVNGQAILQVLLYDPTDSVATSQLLTVVTTICQDKASAEIIIEPDPTVYCIGQTIQLNADDTFNNVVWSNGEMGSMIDADVQDTFTVTAKDDLGCSYQDTIDLTISYPIDESICIVSVDSITGKNVIVWEKTEDADTESFNIYKQTEQANQYEIIANVPFDSLSAFVDETSNPKQASDRYKISAVNSCGSESSLSGDHKTMHLTINQGLGNDINLVWDRYLGFDYSTFNIYRAIGDPQTMTLIAEQASNTFTYTDIPPSGQDLYYLIEVVKEGTCTATRDEEYLSSVSNVVDLIVSDIVEIEKTPIKLYPNPASNNLTIELPSLSDIFDLEIEDISGRLVYSRKNIRTDKLDIELQGFQNGIYIVVLKGNKIYRSKLMIKK